MSRRVQIFVAIVALAAIALAASVVVWVRPPLADARDELDASWRALASALEPRYDALDREVAAVREALGADRTLLVDTGRALDEWDKRRTQSLDAQVALANQLESLAARIEAFVASSPRLRDAQEVLTQARTYDDREPRKAAAAHDAAIEGYDDARSSLARRLLASALGYGARRSFEPS